MALEDDEGAEEQGVVPSTDLEADKSKSIDWRGPRELAVVVGVEGRTLACVREGAVAVCNVEVNAVGVAVAVEAASRAAAPLVSSWWNSSDEEASTLSEPLGALLVDVEGRLVVEGTWTG